MCDNLLFLLPNLVLAPPILPPPSSPPPPFPPTPPLPSSPSPFSYPSFSPFFSSSSSLISPLPLFYPLLPLHVLLLPSHRYCMWYLPLWVKCLTTKECFCNGTKLKSLMRKFFEPFLPLWWERMWDTLSHFHHNEQCTPIVFPYLEDREEKLTTQGCSLSVHKVEKHSEGFTLSPHP